jgi:hypothetical protein
MDVLQGLENIACYFAQYGDVPPARMYAELLGPSLVAAPAVEEDATGEGRVKLTLQLGDAYVRLLAHGVLQFYGMVCVSCAAPDRGVVSVVTCTKHSDSYREFSLCRHLSQLEDAGDDVAA